MVWFDSEAAVLPSEREGTVIYQVCKSFREDEPEEERGGGGAEDGVPGVPRFLM
jgi:hypothetical protein